MRDDTVVAAKKKAASKALRPRAKDPISLAHERAKSVFLSFPGVAEVMKWGSPHMVHGEKLLGSASVREGRVYATFKLEMEHALARVADDERFRPAKYVGKHGWVTMDVTECDAAELAELLREAISLVAPPRKARGKASAIPRARSKVRG